MNYLKAIDSFHFTCKQSGVVLYVGKEGILSVNEFSKKACGQPYELLKFSEDSDGYLRIGTRKGELKLQRIVHRIIVAASLGATYNDLDGLEIDHKDNNRKNNSIDNLQLLTHEDHARKTARENARKFANLNELNIKPVNENLLEKFENLERASEVLMQNYNSADAIREDQECSYVDDKDQVLQCRRKYGAFNYKGQTKKLEDAKEWFDLIDPNNGKKIEGYHISDNLILKLPTGRYTEGSQKADTRRFEFRVKGKRHPDTRWGQASKTGKAVPKHLVIAHNNNNYTNVTVETIRAATSQQNNIESHGKKILVRFDDRTKPTITYDSISLAAEAHGLVYNTLCCALRENRAYFAGVRFLYFMDVQPR